MWKSGFSSQFIAAADRICTNKCLPVKVHLCHMCTVGTPITVTVISCMPGQHLVAPLGAQIPLHFPVQAVSHEHVFGGGFQEP